MKEKDRISTDRLSKFRNFCNLIFLLFSVALLLVTHNAEGVIMLAFCILIIILNYRITRCFIKEVEKYSDSLEKNLNEIIREGKLKDISKYQESILSKNQMQLSRLCDSIERQMRENQQDKEILQGLVSDIAHQVKTPIANAVLYITALRKQDLHEEKKSYYLDILSEQIKKLDFLMNNLLKMSRLEVGIFSLEPKVLPVEETLAGALGTIAIKAEEKDIIISVECMEELTALHDPKWTREVLENVLDNAVKYTPEHGKIDVLVRRNEVYTLIEISDNGVGIPPEEITKIFHRFYRGKNVRCKQGVGIGLYLVREILRMEKGFITVESKIGKGSKFSIYLSNNEKQVSSVSCCHE